MTDIPAIAGGTPVRKELLPQAKPSFSEDDRQAVINVLDNNVLKDGPKVKEFEKEFARFIGTRYAYAVSSGAAGIHIALMAAAVGHKEEVVTSALVHPSTPTAIIHQGGMQTFADIDPSTYNMDIEELRKRISLRTVAILPVHFAGRPCNMEEITKVAGENHVDVIEDASHALGAEFKGKKIGTISPLTVFSFDGPQGVYTGEGGMVVTDSEELYSWLAVFGNGGIVTRREKLLRNQEPWHFEMQDRGYYYRMNEMQAALGLRQLKQADRFLEKRSQIAEQYNKAFAGMQQFQIPAGIKEGKHAWHFYIIALRLENLKATRLEIYNALRAENIGVGVQYMPAFLHPYFKWVGHPDICSMEESLAPRAENIYGRMLSLPLFPAMSQKDVNDVIEAVYRVMTYYSL
jgi:dTDP-4-amino-4,6-dideoxygalactose transaminase